MKIRKMFFPHLIIMIISAVINILGIVLLALSLCGVVEWNDGFNTKDISFFQNLFAFRMILIPFIMIVIPLMILLVTLFFYSMKIRRISLKVEYEKKYDLLTDLPNKSLLIKTLEKHIEEKSEFAIFLIDIDDFRSINDFTSHEVGDLILKTIAERLKTISQSDKKLFVARHSDDRFVVLVENSNIVKNDPFIFYLRQILSTPIKINEQNKNFILRTSIGIVNSTEDIKTPKEYLSNAEIAMLQAKNIGKNKYVFFNYSMRNKKIENAEIARIVETACQKDGFNIVFQPQISTKDGSIHGYEALVRMSYANLFPGQFIPVAEEDGHIAKIGRIVTEKVIKQIYTWRNQGFPIKKVAINYSAGQIHDREYVSYLKHLMEMYNISSDMIGIEITESLFIGNKEIALELFKQFHELGITIALDDFGTGYSSLSYLTFIPLDTVKIDKSLVDTYLREDVKGGEEFIQNIANLVHSLGMKITVEGVEYKWQFEKLKKFGCDYIQGYFFSKPLSPEEIESFVPPKI